MSKSIETFRKSRPLRRYPIVVGLAALAAAGSTLSTATQSPNKQQTVTRADAKKEQSGQQAPRLKSDSVGQMAVALTHMKLGWGDTDGTFVSGGGVMGAVNLPNGEQVVTTIFTKDGSSNVKKIHANAVQIIDVDVYPAGKNYQSAPYQTVESYWFAPNPVQSVGPLGYLYHYDAGVSYNQGPVWMDAYKNGVVDTFSYKSVKGIANKIPELDHTYGNSADANKVVRRIEDQALDVATYAANHLDVPTVSQIEHPKHIDQPIYGLKEQTA